MDPIYVTGHRNPDTDSIVAAIAYAALRNACGDREYEAACLGQVSEETRIVLDRFGFQPPKRIYWADFVGSSVAKDMFPFSVWVKLLRDVTAGEDETALLTDTSAGGIRQLRQAIADHLYQFRGMTIDPEQIVVGAGSEYLVGLIIQLLGRDLTYGIDIEQSAGGLVEYHLDIRTT